MATLDTSSVSVPFPIHRLASRYLLYDVNTITYIRAKYHIPGVLIGGLPQAPQQNVFSGIPLELLPEEARWLCEKGVAFVVDDAKAHKQGFLYRGLSVEERKRFMRSIRRQGAAAANKVKERADERKKAALKQRDASENWNDVPDDMLQERRSRSAQRGKGKKRADGESAQATSSTNVDNGDAHEEEENALFSPPPSSAQPQPNAQSNARIRPSSEEEPYSITPTTSYPPLTATPPSASLTPQSSPTNGTQASNLPDVPPSYPLYRHLHTELQGPSPDAATSSSSNQQSYFILPGLRFGCQYMAYPGDTLRYHSHFLCNWKEWDEEFEMLDLVAGGRLATGVKKGWIVGGVEPGNGKGEAEGNEEDEAGKEGGDRDGVRAFTIEWGGM